jgi:multicomponent Na+:H+ antiporter subunit D
MIRALIPLPVAVPLIVAALVTAIATFVPRWVVAGLFTAVALFNVICTAMLVWGTRHAPLVYWFGNWWPRGTLSVGECFVIAPLPAILAVLVSALTLFASVQAWQLKPAGGHMEPLMLLFMAAMCGFVYAGDLFNLFVWFELMSATAFALCGLKTAEPAPLQGAFNFGITNSVGAFLIVTGIGLIYARTGALNMAQIGSTLGPNADALVLMSFLLMMVGYIVKGAIVPFHLWLADAHAVAPTPVCVLFSGVMVELGLFAVARLYWSVFQAPLAPHAMQLRHIFVGLGTLTVIVGGAMCFAQHHLKRLLAYSTICHAGLMLLAIGLLNSAALGGFLLYVIGHGFLKGGLFASAGIVLHRLQFVGEPHLHGRGRGLVWTPLLFIAGAIGLAAAPGFLLEAGESAATNASYAFGLGWIRWLFMFGGIATAAAVLRLTFRTFFGWGPRAPADEASRVDEKQETVERGRRVPAVLFVPAACMIALASALSFVPHLRESADASARLFTDQHAYVDMVMNTAQLTTPAPGRLPPEQSSLIRGAVAGVAAMALALLTVFRRRTVAGRFLERAEYGVPALREWQSGHPGDYVLWLTVGTAALGACFVAMLR